MGLIQVYFIKNNLLVQALPSQLGEMTELVDCRSLLNFRGNENFHHWFESSSLRLVIQLNRREHQSTKLEIQVRILLFPCMLEWWNQADTTDLKSVGQQQPCGFKSHFQYQRVYSSNGQSSSLLMNRYVFNSH